MTLKLLPVLLIFPVLFNSCKKENRMTRTELLTSKPWIYDVYYTGYQESGQILQYKKDQSGNPLDLTNDVLKFNSDGTFDRIDYQGQAQTGTWHWEDNETQVLTVESGSTRISNTIQITEDNYTWHDTTYHTYGQMIH